VKACFSKTDHDIATCWYQTAAENKAAGKVATVALKNAGTSLEDAAKWSGNGLKKGPRLPCIQSRKLARRPRKESRPVLMILISGSRTSAID
jgi:hypothetical protein